MTSLLDWYRDVEQEEMNQKKEAYIKLIFKKYNIARIEEIFATQSIKILFTDNTTEIYSKYIFYSKPIDELLKKHLLVNDNNQYRKEIISSLLVQDDEKINKYCENDEKELEKLFYKQSKQDN